MIKALLRRAARRLGFTVRDVDRLGVDVETDLARLTAGNPIRTVFDAGGNFGQSALGYAAAFPEATIFTFEPFPESFVRLRAAVARRERIRAFNVALGAAPGTAPLNVTPSAGNNSLLPTPTATARVEVPVDTVDAVAAAQGVVAIDLLKMDVEGSELQVLDGAAGLLRAGRIRFVLAECVFAPDPDWPLTSFFDLHARLESAGFCFVASYAESFVLRHGSALSNVLWALRSRLPVAAPGRVRTIA